MYLAQIRNLPKGFFETPSQGGGDEAAAPYDFFSRKTQINSKKLKSTQKNTTASAINKTPIDETLRHILEKAIYTLLLLAWGAWR